MDLRAMRSGAAPARPAAPVTGTAPDGQPVDSRGARVERRVAPDRLAGTPVHLGRRAVDTLSTRASAFIATLVVVDSFAIAIALTLAHIGRFGTSDQQLQHGVGSFVVASVIWLGWVCGMVLLDAYEPRFLGVGGEEYRRVTRATFVVFAVLAIASYMLHIEVARGFVAMAFPSGLLLILLGRFGARQWLVRERAAGRLCHQVLVIGDRVSVCEFVAQLRQEPRAGFTVIGACLPANGDKLRAGDNVPILGDYSNIADVARRMGADVVAVTASETISPARLRRVAWSLEGSDVDLVVAPAVTDVAGPRVTIRQVAGLPLLYVDEPRFTGVPRLVKGTIDRVGSALGLLIVGIPLLVVAAAVRLTSPGPALFRQRRVGRGGAEFSVFKLRTMYQDAEERRAGLKTLNEGDGLLFKIKDDPRVTPLGRVLRRLSIDELPQLLNVLIGHMSLVGPRPLAVDGEAFVDHEHRRHLVKPGMTGLWQVSGREQQSWDDAVRLDLYYVENWSLAMDLVILMRTGLAVFRGH
jgi:exopolysaccharide biosynthesis polyprenyl glycosylphosphotransferase